MNELLAALCVTCLVGGWIIFMIGRKDGKNDHLIVCKKYTKNG